jgi:nucleoside-diphosphate-sugar epimerase
MSPAREGKAFFTMAPFFHLMGLYLPTQSIFHNIPFVLSPEKPMTVDLLARILDENAPEMAILTPSLIEELASTQKGLDTLKRFEMILFAGAPLSKDVGDMLCKDIDFQTGMGSSEAGFVANLVVSDKADWQYFEWNPAYGVDMQHIMDGTYELVLQKGENRDYHCIFHTYPDIQEYRTKDLFVQHPTKPSLWRYKGRLDDVIVLSNGEKFNPIEMEKVLDGHRLVSRALVVGQGRFQSALLIEPVWHQWDESSSLSFFIDEIWPTVQKANEIAPSHARVLKTKIGLASRAKPFKTTPKGSIQRQAVVNDYAEEIDAIYALSDEEYLGVIPQKASLEDIMQYIQSIVSGLLSVDHVGETSDIFAMGLDSLQTLQLGKTLRGAVRSLRPESDFQAINSQKLYSYPSVKQLSEYIYCLAHGGETGVDVGTDDDSRRCARIAALVEKYTKDLPQTRVTEFRRDGNHAVILTGSTGSLGNYILSELTKDPTISKIYCLNRSDDAETKQVKGFEEKGLEIPPNFVSRVEFFTARFGSEKLGLPDQVYEKLKNSVGTIIHNAWKVNFNHKVEAFEDTHIQGVRRLVDFCMESTNKPHLHFISSFSTIGAWSQKHGPSVPEIPLEDPDVATRQGYGESKYVSERICAIASARSGVPTSIYRVGQIGGPTAEKGLWNKQEWLPSLVATSKTLQQVPNSLGTMPVDWIPVVRSTLSHN